MKPRTPKEIDSTVIGVGPCDAMEMMLVSFMVPVIEAYWLEGRSPRYRATVKGLVGALTFLGVWFARQCPLRRGFVIAFLMQTTKWTRMLTFAAVLLCLGLKTDARLSAVYACPFSKQPAKSMLARSRLIPCDL